MFDCPSLGCTRRAVAALLFVIAVGLVVTRQAAAQSQNLVEGGDPSKLNAFTITFDKGKSTEAGEKHWQWAANTWSEDTSGEFTLADVDGAKALSLVNLSGRPSVQVYNWQKFKLNPGRRYDVSFDYRTAGSGQIEMNGTGVDAVKQPLAATGGKWQTFNHVIQTADARDLGLVFQNQSVGRENALYLKAITVRDMGVAERSAEQKAPAGAARKEQVLEPGSLYAQLKEEFKAVGDAHFVFGQTADETTGRLTNMGQSVAVEGMPFKFARRLEVAERMKQPWEANAQVRNAEPIKKGDVLLVTFYARGKPGLRTVDTGEGAIVQPILKADGLNADYHNQRSLTEEWDRYWIKHTKPVSRDYAPGEVELLIMAGHQAQTVEIGGIAVMAFASGANVEAMPKPSYDYVGREPDAPWRKEAAERIERIRKGDLTVSVVDAAGKPVAGAQVRATLKRHGFKFGTAVAIGPWRGDGVKPTDKENYRRILVDHFNMIETENSLKWRGMTEWGMTPEMTEEQLRWAKEHGMYTRGHVLVWPSWEHTPDAVQKLVKGDNEALRRVVRQHVTETVGRFKDLIDDWDVTNETEGNRDYMDLLGPDEMIEWYKLARAADPDAKLTFTEPGFGKGGMEGGSFPEKQLPGYRGWVDYLVKNSAPLDRLGSQEHGGTMAKIGRKADPREAWKLWDSMVERYGKELLFTELDVNIENDRDEEQLKYQADVLRDSITLAFAHEHMIGINHWGFWEKAHWFPKAALWRADWSIKPIGQAYLDLIHKTWHTDETKPTEASGTATIRGFLGEYELTVTHNGKTSTRTVMLPRAGAQVSISVE